MKIQDIQLRLLYQVDQISINLPKGQHRQILELIDGIKIDTSKDYDIIIKPKSKRRSLDANAYFWTLVGKLADKTRQMKTDIYRKLISEVGVFEIVPIKTDVIEHWVKVWEQHGEGWICEDLGECKNFKGYHNIKSYYGSSTYKTDEMSRLIDSVVVECKEQGIETMTPVELERLKEQWTDG